MPVADGAIFIGYMEQGEAVVVAPETLSRQLAILGGAGSGKTTLALAILAGLLLR